MIAKSEHGRRMPSVECDRSRNRYVMYHFTQKISLKRVQKAIVSEVYFPETRDMSRSEDISTFLVVLGTYILPNTQLYLHYNNHESTNHHSKPSHKSSIPASIHTLTHCYNNIQYIISRFPLHVACKFTTQSNKAVLYPACTGQPVCRLTCFSGSPT